MSYRNLFYRVLAAVVVLMTSAPLVAEVEIVPFELPPRCSGERPADAQINRVMLHFCSDFIAHPDDPFNMESIQRIFSRAGVSAHYFIQRDGTVYQAVDENRKAHHAGGGVLAFDKSSSGTLNNTSIGIEMLGVGSESDMVPLFVRKPAYDKFAADHPDFIGYTDAQYTALNALLKGIETRHPAIKHNRWHIVTHEEYAGRARRTDPGELFDFARIGLAKYPPLQRERNYRGLDLNKLDIFHRLTRLENIAAQLVDIKPTDKTIVMLGDSITEGFPAKEIAGYKVINQGISSDSIDHPTMPIGLMRRLDLVKLARPEHIYCAIGINDICSESVTTDGLEARYIELYDALKEQFPNTKIHVSPVFPVATDKYTKRIPAINEANRRIAKLATERGFDVLDLTPDLTDENGHLKAEFTRDGVHLLKPAYEVWVRRVTENLTK